MELEVRSSWLDQEVGRTRACDVASVVELATRELTFATRRTCFFHESVHCSPPLLSGCFDEGA